MKITRRSLVDRALKGSLLALTFKVGGASLLLTPAEARAQDVPLQKLSAEQARRLGVLAEGMVPGSEELGVVHFLDHQLNADPNEALLIAKYFQVAPPYLNFYARGLEVANGMSQSATGKSIEELDAAALEQLIASMAPPGTVVEEFPIFLFYLCLRSDAIDVVYGTPDGFARLNVPYMQHIMPPEGWNG
ncbi:gluconate 2-dehydrogenase subunit 3 family protein [Elongatibacter sediminis]|uniref:Gluconate 2-dehydrogenase subunit 3 family protein n=1 Tax=Elongatibacter sediminis TaxID=3119006 RepID=A0AAW9R4N2_9GAMM